MYVFLAFRSIDRYVELIPKYNNNKEGNIEERIRDFVHFLAAVRKNYHKSIFFLHKQLNLTSRLLHHQHQHQHQQNQQQQ